MICEKCQKEIFDKRYYLSHGCFYCGDDPYKTLREGLKNNLRKRGILDE